MQNFCIGFCLATVKKVCVVRVLRDNGSIQIDTCKDTPSHVSRRAVRIQKDVCRCCGVTPNGVRRCRRIRTNLEFGVKQILKALVVHRDQHQVGCLAADLETEAGTCESDKDGTAPSFRRSAGHNTLTIGSSDDEVWNAAIRRAFDLTYNFDSGRESIFKITHVLRKREEGAIQRTRAAAAYRAVFIEVS